MAIVKMKKLDVYAMKSERDELLRELQLLGCLELTAQAADKLTDGAVLNSPQSSMSEFKGTFQRLASAIKALDKYAYVKSGLFKNRREITAEDLFDDTLPERAMGFVNSIEDAETQLMKLYADENKLEAQKSSLELWSSLDVPLNVTDTHNVSVQFGTLPANRDLDVFRDELLGVTKRVEFYPAGKDREQQGLLILYHKEDAEPVSSVLRKYGYNRVTFKDYTRTAKEHISAIEKQQDETKAAIDKQLSAFAALGEYRDDIKLCYDRIAQSIETEEAKEKLLETQSVFILSGWVPAPDTAKIEALAGKYCCAYELSDPEPGEEAPIKLKNSKLTEPLNMVTEMYSLPSYSGIDPNPLIMPFFTIFFGLMYNDAGYGLVLIAFSLFIRHKVKLRGTMKYMMGLMTLCGITSCLSGLMTGSFFGDAIPTIARMFGGEATLPYLFSPLDDPLMILIGALAIGVIQIVVGMAINAYMLIRDGHPLDALFDIGSWWLLFAGIAVLALGGTYWIALAGVAALVLTQGRAKPNIAGKIVGGLASLYNITAYFGDILSYSRLMALMLAGGVVATVVNMLGSLPGNIIAYAIIFLVGHIFNMGINIIGTYVHAARLQYLEYFGKFYKEGGNAFKPYSLKTKYVDIIKEEI